MRGFDYVHASICFIVKNLKEQFLYLSRIFRYIM